MRLLPSPDSPVSAIRGRLERNYRSLLILTYGGGTNEILLDLIAQRGYGMPSYRSSARKAS